MRAQWTLICALIFALITACFAVINVESVSVNFLFAQSQIPLILVILGSTLLGGLIVGFFGILRQYRLQRTIRQLRKQLGAIEGANAPGPTKVSGNEPSGELAEAEAGAVTASPEQKIEIDDNTELATKSAQEQDGIHSV